MRWFAYILVCADGAFYVGHCQNLQARENGHNVGDGATFTAKRRPVKVAYSEAFATEQESIDRELQWKRWSRAKKQALIDGDNETLHKLARRRT
ncbi:hypothetical protein PLCT2_01796 [Planctomycetaceae bacterium]|nr:hypothetical protein PLCT2_01796 [Planctomycetaceae bacterium]